MSGYYRPDTTGVNPQYAQVNIPYSIYRANQKIVFKNSPVFVPSLRLYVTDGSGRVLIKDVDWSYTTSDIDQAATSDAFLNDPGFTGTLIGSLTISDTTLIGKTIAVSYQEFYLTLPNRTFDDGTPFEVSVDLIKDLSRGVADMRQQNARVVSPVAANTITPKLLPFDINAEKSGNIITDETITVNTVAGAKVIRLAQGAFFADGLTLTYNGVALTPTTDYFPAVISPLTKMTTSKGGIYQAIFLIGDIAGPIGVSYHAVGGDVQIDDIRANYNLSLAIRDYLNSMVFVTPATIQETPTFRAMHARLTSLEDSMRKLLSGAPTYGDSTSGDAVVRPVIASDAGFHWYTIASLYQVQGSTDIITASQFKGRVFFPTAKVSFSFTADVNLKQTRNPLSLRTDSLVFDPNYTLFSDVSVAAPVYPLFRLVWNESGQTLSGALLQVGIALPTMTDRMGVEDMSSTEGCWVLNKTNPYVPGATVTSTSGPSDTGFVLPDNASIWSNTSTLSKKAVAVPRYDKGYLVYSGSAVALSQLVTTSSTATLFSVALPSYFPIETIDTLVLTMADAGGSQAYDVLVSLPNYQSGTKRGRATFANSANELVTLAATVVQDTLGNITVSFNATRGTSNTPSGMSDLIRYIRARV